MTYKNVKKAFEVWLTEAVDEYWEGSHLHVEKESKNFYYGLTSNGPCSFYAKFPKNKCTKINPIYKIINPDLSKISVQEKKRIDKLKDKILKLSLKIQKQNHV